MPENHNHRLAYAAQIRAARALLNWSQGELAERAGISKQSVNRIENGVLDAKLSTLNAVMDALREAGVEMGSKPNGAIHLEIMTDRIAAQEDTAESP